MAETLKEEKSLEDLAVELAKALLKDGRAHFVSHFKITSSEEKIVVFIRRANKESINAFAEIATKPIAGGWGEPCPYCHGTGRVT